MSEREFPKRVFTLAKFQSYTTRYNSTIIIDYLEELIFTSLESAALLTIVNEDSSVIDYRHLCETFLGVQKNIQD